MAESKRNNAPVRVDAVFPIRFMINRIGNWSAIQANCEKEVRETICAGENFFTIVKNKVSIAI